MFFRISLTQLGRAAPAQIHPSRADQRSNLRAKRRKLVLMTSSLDDAKPRPHRARSVGHSLPWRPLPKWSEPTCSGMKSRELSFTVTTGNTANSHQRLHLSRGITDHPLWCQWLLQNNECKSNRRQITPLRLCFFHHASLAPGPCTFSPRGRLITLPSRHTKQRGEILIWKSY